MKKAKKFIRNEISGWRKWEILWLFFAAAMIISLSIYWGDNSLGIITAVTGVICVVMTGKGKMSCYLFGIINTILYSFIAFGAKYYGELMLNALYYVPMQFVGWFMWSSHMNSETKEVEKTKLSWKWELLLLVLSLLVSYGYGLILKALGGNLPFIDSLSTCLSILAMILSVRRLMEQWILWIVVDIVTIFMWAVDFKNGGTDIAALLMWCIYLLNAVFMFWKWYKESKKGMKV